MARRRLIGVAIVLAAACAGVGHAQPVEDFGAWLAFFGNGDLCHSGDGRLKWWFDGHARFLDDAGGFNQSIVRPGVGWDIGNDMALWAGYGWIATSPVAGPDFDEHRFWQQWTWAPSCGRSKFLFRSRFEQRWLETGDDTGLRWRQLFRGQRELTACPSIYAVAWDELFFHLNDTDWGAEAGLNQNRVFVGFGQRFGPDNKWRVEVGYLNQAINLPGDDNRTNHIVSMNLFR